MRCDICYWHQLSPRTAGGCGKGSVFTWGLHPEDVAAEQVKLGSAIFVNPEDFDQTKTMEPAYFYFKTSRQISLWISSANGKEPL